MRLIIIPSDAAVYVDGVCKSDLDLSNCEIPADVHALQWYTDKGWIEFLSEDPFTPAKPNESITALPDWANKCVEVWQVSDVAERPELVV